MGRGRAASPPPTLAIGGGVAYNETIIQCWHEGAFCDVTVWVDGHSFSAHRLILSAGSDFFHALFCRACTAYSKGPVTLDQMPAPVFEALAAFLYQGECTLADPSLLPPLLMAAARLQVKPLVEAAALDSLGEFYQVHWVILPQRRMNKAMIALHAQATATTAKTRLVL